VQYERKKQKRGKCPLKMNAVLEYKDNKFADSSFGITVDVSLDSDKGVFRRYHVGGNPLNAIDPLGLLDNPFPRLPSFSDAFPCSDTVAPVADIIVGGIEGGFAVVLGTASVVSIAAGPGMWWVPILYGGIAVDTGWDSYNRLKSAINRLNNRNYACNGDKARCQ
jgi:hypothetical protein